MFEDMTIGEILKDFRSIKVSKNTRKFIDDSRMIFEDNGSLPVKLEMKLRQLFGKYNIQIKELYLARERARRTNGLKSLCINKTEYERRIKIREAMVEAKNNDVGF